MGEKPLRKNRNRRFGFFARRDFRRHVRSESPEKEKLVVGIRRRIRFRIEAFFHGRGKEGFPYRGMGENGDDGYLRGVGYALVEDVVADVPAKDQIGIRERIVDRSGRFLGKKIVRENRSRRIDRGEEARRKNFFRTEGEFSQFRKKHVEQREREFSKESGVF